MSETTLHPEIDDMAVDRLWEQSHALTGLIRELYAKLLDEIPHPEDRLEVLRIERRNQLALGAVLVAQHLEGDLEQIQEGDAEPRRRDGAP